MVNEGPYKRLGQSMGAGQRQEQRLETRLLASLEVLALPAAELAVHLREAYESNEALRIEERPAPALPARRESHRVAGGNEHAQWLASLPAAQAGWRERLGEQAPADVDRGWFNLVVEFLDDDGWLRTSDGTLLAEAARRSLEATQAALGRAIGALQNLEPKGLGGRDLCEVLLLQLERTEPEYTLLCTLIEEHLDELARNRTPRIARLMGVGVAAVERLRERLGRLELRPARALQEEPAEPLRPELAVRWTGSGFELSSVGETLPVMSLDSTVLVLARDRSQPADVRQRLRDGVARARALLSAVEQRAQTLRRVAECLLRHQSAFLERGPAQLVPLQQADVAEELGLHPSTVSRAIAGKSIETPHGVLALKAFFQAAAPGGGHTAGALRTRLAELVTAEDPAAPLADDELAERLAREGFDVARRTVAKMRAELGLPSSYRRRRFAA